MQQHSEPVVTTSICPVLEQRSHVMCALQSLDSSLNGWVFPTICIAISGLSRSQAIVWPVLEKVSRQIRLIE
jgi:hypothetical protein